MKRLLTVFLSFVLIMAAAFPVLSEDNSGTNDVVFKEIKAEHKGIFVGLGIISEDYYTENINSAVTRGDFAYMLAAMLGAADIKATQSYFSDVDLYHYAAGSIQMLFESGIIAGCGDGTFAVNRTVTAEEASAMLLRIMGYDAIGSGNDKNYVSAKIRSKYSGELTLSQCLEILYNAMFEETIVINGLSGSGVTYSKGDIFLREVMNLDYCDGVLQTAGGRSIYDNLEHHRKIVVGGNSYAVDSDFPEDLLGFKVRVYYSTDTNEDKAVALEMLNNTVLTVDMRAYKSYSDNVLSYYGASGGLRKASIINKKDILYNKGVVDDILKYIPKYGNIRLIDNNSDGRYDVVMISGYDSAVISRASNTDMIVQFKNRSAVNLSDYDRIEIVDKNGAKLEVSDLKENDSVCIYTFEDEYIRLEISSDSLIGKIDTIRSEDDDWKEFTVDGSEYFAYSGYASQGIDFTAGQTVTLLIDVYGRIAGIITDGDSEWKIGYIMSVKLRLDNLRFEVLNQNGQLEKIDAEEYVKLDGVKKNIYDLQTDINTIYQNFNDVDSSGNEIVTTRIMRYFVNADGKISKIDTPTILTMLDYKGVTVSENNKLLMRVKGRLHRPESGYKYKIDSPGRVVVDGEVEPSANNIAFVIPEETNTDPDPETDYSVTKIESLKAVKGGDYYISAYNYSPESLTSDILVIRKDTGTSEDSNIILVDSVVDTYNEETEEVEKVVKGYVNAQAKEYVFDEKNSAVGVQNIKRGDVISFKVQNDKMLLRDLIWREDGTGGSKLNSFGIYSSDGTTFHYYSEFRVLLGKIERIDGKFALLDVGNTSGFKYDLFTLPNSVLVYDTKGEKGPFYTSESSSIRTLKDGSADTVIVAQGKRGGVTSMIVIK